MLRWPYVTAQQLKGFDRYKYSAVDTNPLSVYVMQHLWNRIVKIVPLWIAPNLLTFSGFLLILINYLILCHYDWDYSASGSGRIPNWVWWFAALSTFCAYTLDSIDGKHARRTQSCTPLGELFDHGLDSWATSLFILSWFSACASPEGTPGVSVHTMYLSLIIVLFNFMFSHWEKYNTGVLFLPWGYDLSQVALVAAYVLTASVGVEIWYRPLVFGYYITAVLMTLIIGCSIFLSLPQTLHNIHMAYMKKTLKKDSLYESLLPLVSPAILFLLLTAWVALSPCDILIKQPRLFLWMVGVAFSNVTCRVIICQMSNTRSEPFHWLLFPLAAVVFAAITGLLGRLEESILTVLTVLATAAHVHYGLCVGRQLSQHFNIYTFSMKKPAQE
ncbi:ethanolaminephosphotransferase 1-like isoform X1 [Tachyglossus aculeatus]|uniref:ethanolaminephosphotransferase 1-like isoform X1 n=2 Tax=Tachyglossus aculeatus TaxID=9261 RepID=UPI0018F357CC|nr:ethanolaminephosphotransferase 1-like isoform X1 [Tachyglossus aculeatus]